MLSISKTIRTLISYLAFIVLLVHLILLNTPYTVIGSLIMKGLALAPGIFWLTILVTNKWPPAIWAISLCFPVPFLLEPGADYQAYLDGFTNYPISVYDSRPVLMFLWMITTPFLLLLPNAQSVYNRATQKKIALIARYTTAIIILLTLMVKNFIK